MPHQRRPGGGGLVIIICGVLGAAVASLGAVPVAAQANADEIVVTGQEGGKRPHSQSYKVTYADLDLRTNYGRQELNRRIKVTAEYLCHEVLAPGHIGHFEECREHAIQTARPGTQAAIRRASERTGAWKSGHGWTPPGK